MIKKAEKIARDKKYNICYMTGNALELHFKRIFFDIVLFTFNGLMQIPEFRNRLKVFKQVRRVLKPGGYFIFTAHDREHPVSWRNFWKLENIKWDKGMEQKELHEFGDIIIKICGVRSFLHIPDNKEVMESIHSSGLALAEKVWRSDICRENKAVRDFSFDNWFWITQKPVKKS